VYNEKSLHGSSLETRALEIKSLTNSPAKIAFWSLEPCEYSQPGASPKVFLLALKAGY
jgi:hypothetical protein